MFSASLNFQNVFNQNSYFNFFSEKLREAAIEAAQLRTNPGIYQKIAYLSVSILELNILNYPSAARFGRLARVFSMSANVQDAYSIFKYPSSWRFIDADMIDEKQLKEDCQIEISKSHPNCFDKVEKIINVLLETIRQNPDQNKKAIKLTLANFKSKLEEMISEEISQANQASNQAASGNFKFSSSLNENKWLHQPSLAERIIGLNWSAVDCVCVAWWFHEWKFIDAKKFAASMGQLTVFQAVKGEILDNWLIGLICTGCAFELLEDSRKLCFDTLRPEERQKALGSVFSNGASLVFYSVVFSNMIGQTAIAASYVHTLAVCSRSIGLYRALFIPA